jgi:ribA/ribD-fused uncharacterized protein
MLTRTKDYVFFYYGDDIYSNFYRIPFEFAGLRFFCSEQALMWAKAMYFRDYATASKIAHVDPKPRNAPFQCKMLGRGVKPYNDDQWAEVRYTVMCDILMAKFGQNVELTDELLATEDRVIVEASPTDVIWGIGMDTDNPDILDSTCWRGLNLLGNALMYTRERLRSQRNNNSIQ